MARPRTTIDAWELQVNYGDGWEEEITEYGRYLYLENARAYRENCQYPQRWIKRRPKKSEFTANQLAGFAEAERKARDRWRIRREKKRAEKMAQQQLENIGKHVSY